MTLAEMLKAADAASVGIEVTKSEFKPLPPGMYKVAVSAAEGPVDSKRANPTNPSEFGKLIKLTFDVTDGEFTGRKLFMNNNIIVYPRSTSAEDIKGAQTAMAIGNNERKVLLASIGKNGIERAEELVGATCVASVVITKGMNGKDRNEIRKILAVGAATPAPTPSASAATAQSAVRTTKMPWEV